MNMKTNREIKIKVLNPTTNTASITILPIIITNLFIFTLVYQNIDKISKLVLGIIILGALIISLIILSIFSKDSYINIKKVEEEKLMKLCRKCAMDDTKHALAEYGLITLDRLLLKERELKNNKKPKSCIVYNYTTLDTTFDNCSNSDLSNNNDNIIRIIQNNIKSGIKYIILYTNKEFVETEFNNDLYGKKNLFYVENDELYKNAYFDILIYKTPQRIEGFVTVNFSSTDAHCETCEHKNKCDIKNANLFYQELSPHATNVLIKKINKLTNKRGNQNENTRQ